ncbi:MAG TPA: addiction module protein [Burkholderiaceae bacterium]
MQDLVSELARLGRTLPLEDRERLVDELLRSISEDSPSEIDPAWEAEIERRVTEIKQGKVELLDARDVFARARHRFG